MDLLFLALAAGFFALSIGLIALFERVRGEP